jgi:hypothetical protein
VVIKYQYQISKDYDIDKPIHFDKLINILKELCRNIKVLEFDDFKNNVVLKGARTTLENEFKISKTEALNYIMGFPLSFNLEPFVKLFGGITGGMNGANLTYHDAGHIARLTSDFDKKKELIRQNFKNSTIDAKEFKDWAESKNFITLK